MIEIPGLVLHRPLVACGDHPGVRLLGKTMLAGVEFWVDLLQVRETAHPEDEENCAWREGYVQNNEDMISDVYTAMGCSGGDWKVVHISGSAEFQDGHGTRFYDDALFVMFIYPTLE